jgi:VWFA-related protein
VPSQGVLQLATFIILLCGAAVAAQQPSSAPVFRSRVDAIEIELRVVDAEGQAINDLTVSDVEVLENGRRQDLIAFSRVSVPATQSSVRAPAGNDPSPDVGSNRLAAWSRIYLLILDDLHVDHRNTLQVQRAARRFIEQHVQPGDQVSVVFTGSRSDAAQDFTSDRSLVLRAIDRFSGSKLRPAVIERMEQYDLLFRARGRPGYQDLRDPQDAERAFNARAAMATIEAAATSLARLSGRRKAALIFSEGLDYDLSGLRSQGRSAGAGGPTVLPSTIPTGGSEADAIGRLGVHSYAHDVLLSLQAAIGAAARANVVLYPVDVQGGDTTDTIADLRAPVDDSSLGLTPQHVNQEMRDAQEALAVLAANTGGFAALTPSDLDAVFSRIVRESSDYYLLAYSPWNPAPDGTFREIAVNVRRPGVRVFARRGYYAPRQPLKPAVRFVGEGIGEETSALVMAPVPTAGLPMQLHTAAFRRDAATADVVVTTGIDGRELAERAHSSGVDNILELALMAIDSAGRVRAATSRQIEVRLDEPATRLLRASVYRVVSRVQLPPGRYQIRQSVRERTGGRHGSVFVDLDVPEFSRRLTVSGILLTSKQSLAVPTAVDRESYDALPILPSVVRTFSSDDELIVASEVYAPSSNRDDVVVAVTVEDEYGQERYRRVTKATAAHLRVERGMYRHGLQIPLEGLSGEMVLTLEASRAGAPHDAVRRRVPFSVVSK